MGGSRGGKRPSPTHILEKSQVAFGFLRNTVTDLLEKQIGPIIASPVRFIQPFVKYLDDLKKDVRIPITKFYGSAHEV